MEAGAFDRGLAVQNRGLQLVEISADEVRDLVIYQIGALDAFARALGGRLTHVKPHGALYNMAARDRSLARAIAEAVKAFDSTLILFGLSGSELPRAGKETGLRVASEVFADRAYLSDGSLAPRGRPDAMIRDVATALAQVRRMIRDGYVRSVDNIDVPIDADTLCIHGDQPGAVEFARSIRAALETDGVRIAAAGL